MMKKYTQTHEWVEMTSPAVAVVGVSDYAKQELGEVVYVQLPAVGQMLSKGDVAVVLESTKAAVDVYAPVSGKVVQVNEALMQDLASFNTSPEDLGWLFRVERSADGEWEDLLTGEQYRGIIAG